MEGGREVALSSHRSSWFRDAWHGALCYSSYYKFAAKMIGGEKRVLDIGCGDGLGTWILAKECGSAKGIDQDREAIAVAQKNWREKRIAFECSRLAELQPRIWDAVVSLDADREFKTKNKRSFFVALKQNLSHDGIAILGIPGFLRQRSLRKKTKRLEGEMRRCFRHVFMFSACDEMIHAGVSDSANHFIAVGCRSK